MMLPKIHIVVHVLGSTQAQEQVRIARDAGADGVWLIDHANDFRTLSNIVWLVRGAFPDFWLGVNFLDQRVDYATSMVDDRINGLWSDNAHVHPDDDIKIAERAKALRVGRGWKGLYFGGVAFKGQSIEHDVAAAAERAADLVDVVTTSGAATGVSAPEEKVRLMHEALRGRRPLALASGITPDNVEIYLPYTDYLMVATGVSRNFHELDPAKVERLVGRVRAWSSR